MLPLLLIGILGSRLASGHSIKTGGGFESKNMFSFEK